MDLITSGQALALLPGLSAVESAAVPGLIPGVSRAIERYCKHKLGYGSYVEYHRPGLTRRILLDNPPVIPGTVELRTDLEDVAAIACVDPQARRATATLTTSTLTLSLFKAGGPSPTPLALSSYATLADLAAAVNGTAGWSMTANQTYADWLVADLEPNPGAMGALGGRAVQLVAYVRDVSRWAMDCPEVGSIELLEGRPQAFRYPDRMFNGSGGMGYGYWFGQDPRCANVRCGYQAGYDPTGVAAPVPPDDLQLAVALSIKATLDAGNWSGTITSANLGNTTVAIGDQCVIPKAAIKHLSPYRLRRI